MQVFKSKIDTWLAVVISVASLISLFSVYMIMVQPSGGWIVLVIAVFILALGVGLPLWILLSTKYAVSTNTLIVTSGPFRWRIALNRIKTVVPTRNPLSSPALSLDRLEIKYDKHKVVLISPANKAEFMTAIGQQPSA